MSPRCTETIDSVLRTTVMLVYKSDDFYEGVCASHNDHDAMRAYAEAFLDAFWESLWAGYRAGRLPAGAGEVRPMAAQPDDPSTLPGSGAGRESTGP